MSGEQDAWLHVECTPGAFSVLDHVGMLMGAEQATLRQSS